MRNGRVWKMPPAKVPPPVIAPRSTGLPRPVRSPVSDRPSEKAMLTPAPRAVATPVKNAVRGRWVARATAKMGARVDSDPSISPLSAGWTRVRRNGTASGLGTVLTGAVPVLVLISDPPIPGDGFGIHRPGGSGPSRRPAAAITPIATRHPARLPASPTALAVVQIVLAASW